MKNSKMICVVFVSLAFSGVASAGFLDSLNQAAESVQDTTEKIKNINNTAENEPAAAEPAKAESAAETVKTEPAAEPAKTDAVVETVKTDAAAESAKTDTAVDAAKIEPAAETVKKDTAATVAAKTDAAAETAQTGLVDTLMKQLGITSDQAQGGSGALFDVAKNNMSESDFSQVSQAVPGMDGILAAAPKSGSDSATGNLLSGLAEASGNSTLTDATSLINAFQQLDLSEGMVGKFTPVIIDYVKQNGGEQLANILQAALAGS